MGRHYLAVGLLALAAASGGGSVGCDNGVKPVLKWLVAFATGTGEWVSERAQTLAAAIEAAWDVLWGNNKVNDVFVDEGDPLRGTYDGVLKCAVEWLAASEEQRQNRLEIELDHPKMVRESESSTSWELAPEEKKRIEELRDQLMRAG